MCLKRIFHDEIEKLAYSFSEMREKRHGSELDNWVRAEKTIINRVIVGVIYLMFGSVLVVPLLFFFMKLYSLEISWCVGWAMLGVGAGLINTRNHPQGSLPHLSCYWFFIVIAVSTISFTFSLYKSHNIYANLGAKFYSLSASISLIGGFLGHIFHDLIISLGSKVMRIH